MNRSNINGCCVGSYFYNLGGEHGHQRYNKDNFAKKFKSLGFNYINLAVINTNQKTEENNLKNCGFEVVFTAGRMKVLAAGSTTIRASPGLKELIEQEEKERRERELKRLEAAKKARDLEIKQRKKIAALRKASKLPEVNSAYVKMMQAWTRKQSNNTGQIHGPREACLRFLKTSPQFTYNSWNGRDHYSTARTINNHLKRLVKD